MSVGGIVLAAGESRRFGSAKALALWRGKTFVQNLVHAMLAAELDPRVIVLGFNAEAIRSQLKALKAKTVVNERYELEQFSSLQCGLRAIGEKATGVIVALVDQPHIPSEIFARLSAEMTTNTKMLVQPEVDGRRSHPVGIGSNWFRELLEMSPRSTLRDFFSRHADHIRTIPWPEPSLLIDIDTKEDLKALEASLNLPQ